MHAVVGKIVQVSLASLGRRDRVGDGGTQLLLALGGSRLRPLNAGAVWGEEGGGLSCCLLWLVWAFILSTPLETGGDRPFLY